MEDGLVEYRISGFLGADVHGRVTHIPEVVYLKHLC